MVKTLTRRRFTKVQKNKTDSTGVKHTSSKKDHHELPLNLMKTRTTHKKRTLKNDSKPQSSSTKVHNETHFNLIPHGTNSTCITSI